MRAGDPMAEALRSELEPEAKKLKKRLRKARRGKPGAVHDARTSIRRLREGLAVIGRTVFDAARVADLADALKNVERALGPTRDDDVLLADIDAYLDAHLGRSAARSGAATAPLARLRAWAREQRDRHRRELAGELARSRRRRAARGVRRWLEGHARDVVSPPKDPAKAVPCLVRHFVPEETWHAYESVLAFELRHPADLEVIHQVRSAARRLRYLLELLRGALAPGADDIIRSLQTLQDRLGELHDHAVAVERIERAIASGRLDDTAPVRSYIAYRREARDRLRGEFPAEWAALSGEDFRFALSHLVSGEMRSEPPDAAVVLVPRPKSAA